MPSSESRSFPRSPLRSAVPVRHLNAASLGIILHDSPSFPGHQKQLVSAYQLPCEIADDDPVFKQVRLLLDDGFAGVTFVGPPGTGKSWYAAQLAAKLADRDPGRVRFIQFHTSYQYEDFVEGYVPTEGGGFRLAPKHLLEMCEVAYRQDARPCVLVIDELSRSDPGRVLGEALTYIDATRRGQSFHLASGREASIPANLIFLATMNPADRGVDEVDVALERRFAKIAMDPDPAMLDRFLTDNGMDQGLQGRVLIFFRRLLGNPNPHCKVGHAYFRTARDEDGLKRLWDHQLRFHFEKAFRLDAQGFRAVADDWEQILHVAARRRQGDLGVAVADPLATAAVSQGETNPAAIGASKPPLKSPDDSAVEPPQYGNP